MQRCLEAVFQLHQYILRTHWDGEKLIGPDPVGKIHWRFTRFVRSYLGFLPGQNRYVYLQGLGYWILANLCLSKITGEKSYETLALKCADYIVSAQPTDGAWRHPPIRGRVGFISTVEGVWASLGLMKAFGTSGDERYLDSARRWYDFQVTRIGFQSAGDGLAANYYSHSNQLVPNVTTMLVWLTGLMWRLTGNSEYLEYSDRMIRFVSACQMDNGELPYIVHDRPHFMCFQYNAFQFLDLAHYQIICGGEGIRTTLNRLAIFVAGGMTERGACRRDCFRDRPEVAYWTGALAAALRMAQRLGLGTVTNQADLGFDRLLSLQRPDGGFGFSQGDYVILRDRRSYPRSLAMILYHLLLCVDDGTND